MTGAYSRRKGNAAEVAVVNALKARGIAATTTRNVRGGSQGGADIACDLPVAVEVKNCAKVELAAWVDQARSQADDCWGAVVHKRPRKADAGDWYLTMTLGDFVEMCAQITTEPLSDADVPF